MKIAIAQYNPDWPAMFERQKQQLTDIIGEPLESIEHIGSTAVPNLAAKPIIDIMVGLKDFHLAEALVSKLVEKGYEYFPQYEDEMPNRRFFIKSIEGQTLSHIHMVEFADEFWQRHLLFRDYLRANREVARQYEELKKQLAMKDWPNSNDYANAKTDFIRKIEAQAAKERQNQ